MAIKYIYFIRPYEQMAILPSYWGAAIVLSIVALVGNPLTVLFFRHYYRGLQFLQMLYLFAITMATTSFSSNLTTVVLEFDKNFLTFCTAGDFVCQNGFRLSFGACLVGLIFACLIFVLFQKCCNKTVEFQPVFNALKGFIMWFYMPLIYASTLWILTYVQKTPVDFNSFLLPAILVACLAIFPLVQLIGYKCIQQQDTPAGRKWMQFLAYLRMISTGALTALFTYYRDEKYLNCLIIVMAVYSILYLIFGDFRYKVMERIVFFVGDASFIILYFFFNYKPTIITDYDLDFFLVASIMGIDTLTYFIRAIRVYCYGAQEGQEGVNPEVAVEPSSPRLSKPKNKYERDTGQSLQNSREELVQRGRGKPNRR